jgi:medium-chain acyl-[acyl-carrier-protein] hydrolase
MTTSVLLRGADDSPVHLICVPHAGGGAASFNRWLGLFPTTIAVVRTQLPGREDRASEPHFRRVGEAVSALVSDICLLDSWVALYGHSMGALVAFELAHELCAAGAAPVHLFVSGRRAPHRSPSRTPIHDASEPDLITALRTMGGMGDIEATSPEFRQYVLALIRADLELSEKYTFGRTTTLPCPITAFYGTGDPVVDPEEVRAWAAHSHNAFRSHEFTGDHFFHQQHRDAIAAHMVRALDNVVPAK